MLAVHFLNKVSWRRNISYNDCQHYDSQRNNKNLAIYNVCLLSVSLYIKMRSAVILTVLFDVRCHYAKIMTDNE